MSLCHNSFLKYFQFYTVMLIAAKIEKLEQWKSIKM